MILGVGVDLLNCERLKKTLKNHGMRFLERIATPLEIQKLGEKFSDLPLLENYYENKKFLLAVGKIFAAKEAASKALGTGFRGGIILHSFQMLRNSMGKPEIIVSDIVKDLLKKEVSSKTSFKFHLSITDEWPYVEAFVVLERE
jgi:holo-[acyl-carrier protein] synthase